MENYNILDKISGITGFTGFKSINNLDLFIVISFAVILLISWHRGLLLSLYNLFSFIIAIALSNFLYPLVGNYLRSSENIYLRLNEFVTEHLNIGEALDTTAKAAQNQLILSLGMPDKITNSLIENNNPEVHRIFSVNAIEGYVAGFITNMLINVIAMAAVFVIVSLILALISRSLKVVSKLPVIKTFNKLGGLLLGACLGVLFIWLSFTVMFLFFPKNYQEIGILVKTSVFAKYFYEHNIFMDMILKIY